MTKLNQTLVEKLKKEALDYSLKTNVETDKEKVLALFKLIYGDKCPKDLEVEIYPSPLDCQKRANELCGTEGKFYSDISHNSLSHATTSYKYLIQEEPGRVDKRLRQIVEQFNCYYYAIALTKTVLVSEYPTAIHVNDKHQYHNLFGPALEFKNGDKFYFFSGIEVDKDLAETPVEKITSKMLTQIDNADVRRDFIEKIGNERLLEILDYETIDTMDEYELITFDIGDGRVRPFLKFPCTSMGKNHVHGVHPECKSVKDALKFKWGAEWKRPIWEDEVFNGGEYEDFRPGQVVQRHGDVLLKKTSQNIQIKGELQKSGVLHRGTSNNHCLEGEFVVGTVSDKKYLKVVGPTGFAHQEHGSPKIEPRIYWVGIDTEYNHWKEEAEEVRD